MKIKKIFWFIMSQRYHFIFNKFGCLSYIGKSIGIINKGKIIINSRVRIQPGLRMETVSKNGLIEIGSNTSIGQNFHITSGDMLKIGENVTILGNVFITNIDHDYQEIGVPILEQQYIMKKTMIGDNCFIGYGAAIQAGTILGKQCIVGTNSVVRGEFPDYCVIVGSPARIVKVYDETEKKWIKV